MSSGNNRLGRWGEQQARRHLESSGYAIVDTNYRCRVGEIDIVARHGEELVFVEVKTRRGDAFGGAEESITPARAERIAGVAEEFLQSRPGEEYRSDTQWRIDLFCLNLDGRGRLLSVNHIEHAVEF